MVKAKLLEKVSLQAFEFCKNQAYNLYSKIYGKFFTSVTIHSMDALYIHVVSWLKENNFDKDCRNYRYMTVWDATKQVPLFGPNYGSYLFWVNKMPLWVNVSVSDAKVADDAPSYVQTMETITLTSFTKGNVVQNIILEVYEDFMKIPKTSLEIRSFEGHSWRRSRELPKKKSGLILAEGLLEDLEKELTLWKNSKEWYVSRDVPYRKGYLFYGMPGTGKTSLVKYLSKFLEFNIYIANAHALSQENFSRCIQELPKQSILLIEDIDCLYSKRQSKQAGLVDFSSLLNGLDGLVAVEDIVIVMTTNTIMDLDPALMRPGRIDRVIEIGLCTTEQAQRLFEKFYPDTGLQLNLAPNLYSPATLQELFLRCQSDTEVLIEIANNNILPSVKKKVRLRNNPDA